MTQDEVDPSGRLRAPVRASQRQDGSGEITGGEGSGGKHESLLEWDGLA